MLDVDADGTAPRHTHRQGGHAHTGKKNAAADAAQRTVPPRN